MTTSVASSPLAGVAAADVMSPGLLTCERETPRRELASIMAVNEVHSVALADAGGVITALDLIAAPEGAVAADIASSPATVLPSDGLADAAAAMAREHRSHVLVVGRSSTLPLGVVSTLDVAAVLAKRNPRLARLVRPRPARPAISTSVLDRVTVGEAMHPGLLTCRPGAALSEVAGALVDHRVHMLVAGDEVIDDVAVARAAAEGRDVATPARIERIGAHETLAVAAARMAETRSGHLLVTIAGGERPVGVLSAFDVVEVLAVT